MVTCEQCGGEVPSHRENCPSCGAPIQPPAGQGPTDDDLYVDQGPGGSTSERSQMRQDKPAGQAENQPPHPSRTAAESGDSNSGQPATQRSGQRAPAGQTNQSGAGEDGLGRRELLIGGVVLAGVAAGGFVFLGSDDDDSPEAVMENYYQAYADGDVERINDLTHTESPDYPVDEQLTDEEIDQLRNEIEVDVEETDLVEENDEQAVVEITVTFSGMGRENTETQRWELRTEGGEWKVWGPTPRNQVADTPAVQFEIDFATDTGTLEITHVGGDAVQADRIRIEGEGIEASGFWYDFDSAMGPDGEVAAGDSIAIDAGSDYSVDVVWNGPDGNSMVLGTDDGPDA